MACKLKRKENVVEYEQLMKMKKAELVAIILGGSSNRRSVSIETAQKIAKSGGGLCGACRFKHLQRQRYGKCAFCSVRNKAQTHSSFEEA